MAVNITVVRQGTPRTSMHIVDIEATADGDTTATIPHGLGATPQAVSLAPLAAAARVSDWIVTSIGAVNVVLTKTTGGGSGAAGNQLRCVIERPSGLAG